jgi:hypothetical protein
MGVIFVGLNISVGIFYFLGTGIVIRFIRCNCYPVENTTW